jgi:integral membrane protein (TIGR01906 family)
MRRIGRLISSALVAVATMIVIVTFAVALFANPIWLVLEQDKVQATAQTGYTIQELGQLDRAILGDMFFGPGRFDAQLRGEVVFNERERQHLADVRTAFFGLGIAAVISIVVLIATRRLRRDRAGFWAAVRAGAGALAGSVIGAAIFVIFAFPVVFELFHRLLFPGGTYTFDPTTERLVQVFPQALWSDTTLAAGLVILIVAAFVYTSAGKRSREAAARLPPPGTGVAAAQAGSAG